jgi:arabinan endo-1,5-alpha-L-arabinosidase
MFVKGLGLAVLSGALLLISACATGATVTAKGALAFASPKTAGLSYSSWAQSVLAANLLTGNTGPMHDPSMIRQGSVYYAFTSDFPGQSGGYLLMRCSGDRVHWTGCGAVFQQMPAWVGSAVPGALCFWAPDISYFNGLYHLYYAASSLGSQRSAIGLVTNTTLDPHDPAYKWMDHGMVLASKPGDDFNAIDPNILVDADRTVWLTYGSYWSGIKQRAVDPRTGMLAAADSVRYDLATRPSIAINAIEGASLIQHGDYYYLFVSVDSCCNASALTDNYKQAVGRATSPHGPFVDMLGAQMMNGGGTVVIEGDGLWNAPGGGTAWIDPDSGDAFLAFHALNMSQGGTPYLWLKTLQWENDWPVVE